MMKEEKNLLEKCGKKNPFTVPEGYFESFTDKLMEQLPEKESQEVPETGMWQRIKPWVYMAAMFCGLMLSVRVFVGEKAGNTPEEIPENISVSELPDELIDPIFNQTMMDDYTLYQYLTDADTEIYQ